MGIYLIFDSYFITLTTRVFYFLFFYLLMNLLILNTSPKVLPDHFRSVLYSLLFMFTCLLIALLIPHYPHLSPHFLTHLSLSLPIYSHLFSPICFLVHSFPANLTYLLSASHTPCCPHNSSPWFILYHQYKLSLTVVHVPGFFS